MAALELVIQKDIKERRHFIVDFGISRLWQTKKHLHKLRRYLAGDNLAVLPVIVFQTAILERQLDPLRLFAPTVDLKGLCTIQCRCDIGHPFAVVYL